MLWKWSWLSFSNNYNNKNSSDVASTNEPCNQYPWLIKETQNLIIEQLFELIFRDLTVCITKKNWFFTTINQRLEVAYKIINQVLIVNKAKSEDTGVHNSQVSIK